MRTTNTCRAAKLIIVFFSMIWLVPSMRADVTLGSGASCNAANLAQALLGISMSQNGIVNNATIPLFVVCSVDLEIDTVTASDVGVEAVFPPGGGSIPCTYRVGIKAAPGFLSAAFTVVSGFNNTDLSDEPFFLDKGPISPFRGVNSVDSANGDGTGATMILGGANQTIVCALDPGEGIATIGSG